MEKQKELHLGHVGTVLTAIRYYDDCPHPTWHNDRLYIGTPSRMFEFDPCSASQIRRVCVLYGIDDDTLFKFVTNASQHPNEHQFLTL